MTLGRLEIEQERNLVITQVRARARVSVRVRVKVAAVLEGLADGEPVLVGLLYRGEC